VNLTTVWVVEGHVHIGGVAGTLFVHDGNTWTTTTVAAVSNNDITGIGGSSVNDLFMVAKTGKIAHSSGL